MCEDGLSAAGNEVRRGEVSEKEYHRTRKWGVMK